MTINQLFTKKPSKELVEKLIQAYGLSGFDDETTFSKRELDKNNLFGKLSEIIKDLKDFYLPCKRKIYLEDINYKKSITILRQCLKLYNYKIKSKEKYFNGDKIIIYQILANNNDKTNKKQDTNCVISFD